MCSQTLDAPLGTPELPGGASARFGVTVSVAYWKDQGEVVLRSHRLWAGGAVLGIGATVPEQGLLIYTSCRVGDAVLRIH